MNPAVSAVVLGLLGLAAGGGLAVISVRLPREGGDDPAPSVARRLWWIAPASGLIGVWAGFSGSTWLAVGASAVLGWQLLLIAIVDAEHHWLPDRLTGPLAATGLIAAVLTGWPVALNAVIGAAAGFIALWALGWTYRIVRGRDGLGGGDPVLFGAVGAWVGWQGLPSVLVWAVASALVVVFWQLVVRRSLRATDRLPFGVFLAVGAWLTWLYGPVGA